MRDFISMLFEIENTYDYTSISLYVFLVCFWKFEGKGVLSQQNMNQKRTFIFYKARFKASHFTVLIVED